MGKLREIKKGIGNVASTVVGGISSAASATKNAIASLDESKIIHYGIQQPFEVLLGNPAMLLYRTAGLAFNVMAAVSESDISQFKFDKPTMELSSKFYNMLSSGAGVIGYDMGRYEAYDPDFLSPKNDESDKTYFYIKTAEQFSFDLLNNTGFAYDINLTSADSLKSYLAERIKSIKYIEAKIQEKKPDYILDLTLNPELVNAEIALNKLQKELKDLHETPINPSKYQDEFKTLSDNLAKALANQLKTDKKTLSEIGTADTNITDLTDSLQKTLEYPEKKEKDPNKKEEDVVQTRLQEFKKEIAKDADSFQQAANHDMRRISFLTQVVKQDPSMRKVIEELAIKALERRQDMDEPASLDVRILGPGSLNFKNIDPNIIKKFTTNTGVEISVTKDEKENEIKGAYSIKFPNRFSPYHYGFKGEQNIKFDMTMLVKALVACNPSCTSIIMTIRHKDPNRARILALEAFKACRDEGFDESKITINVNGKEMPLYDKIKTVEGKEQIETKGLLGRQDIESTVTLKSSIDAHSKAYQEARTQNFASLKSRAAELKPAEMTVPEAAARPSSATKL